MGKASALWQGGKIIGGFGIPISYSYLLTRPFYDGYQEPLNSVAFQAIAPGAGGSNIAAMLDNVFDVFTSQTGISNFNLVQPDDATIRFGTLNLLGQYIPELGVLGLNIPVLAGC